MKFISIKDSKAIKNLFIDESIRWMSSETKIRAI